MPIPLLAIAAAMAAAGGIGSAIGASRREDEEFRNPLEDNPENQTVDPDQAGLFNSVMEAIGRPGKMVNNALIGNWEGVGRQGVDLLGDAVDAVLPGDWIPHVSRRMDKPEFSDVLGGMDPGIGKFAVDVLGGAATDPTMLIPGAALAKVGKAGGELIGGGIRAADRLLPGTADALAEGGRKLRSVFAAERVSPEVRAIIAKGDAGKLETDAGLGALGAGPISKLSDDEAMAVTDILHNRHWNGDQMLGRLAPEGTTAAQRIPLHPLVTPENQGKITDAVQQAIEIGQNQGKRPGILNPADLPQEYLAKSWTGQTEEQAMNEALGREPDALGLPGATKARKLLTPEEDMAFMEQNPGVSYERDARKLMAQRAETQGRLAKKAEIGRAIAGPEFSLVDDASRAKVEDYLRNLVKSGDVESARVLQDHWKGVAPRGSVTSLLAKANIPFKRAAVSGFVIPKFGADVRNRLSGIWQTVANPEARGAVGGMVTRFVSDLAGSVSDAIGMKMGGDRFRGILTDWESALGQSGGSADKAIEIMRKTQPQAADLIANGALDGYTRAEDLLKSWKSAGTKVAKLKSASEMPQRIMRGLEDRMRLGLGLDLMDQGKSAGEAARITGDALYRYGSGSAANRTARDIIPFFQFSAKAIPQTAKFFAEQPAVATGLSRAMSSASDPDAPVYPFMQGKLNIPLGLDANGDRQFINGLGLPFESLSAIPDLSNNLSALGRSIERDTVGASQPLLKTAFGAISGEDPYFESGFGSYGKMPLLGEAGAAGRAYNTIAGTGLLQMIDSPARLIDKALDDRRGPGMKALDLLTGANVTSVDPNKALQQQLQQRLEQNPTVHSHQSLYATDSDPQTAAMLNQYNEAKRRIKIRREQEAAKAKAADVL